VGYTTLVMNAISNVVSSFYEKNVNKCESAGDLAQNMDNQAFAVILSGNRFSTIATVL
jgi:hypothetical protein